MRLVVGLLTDHLLTKLLALGLALAMWYLLTQQSRQDAELTVLFEVTMPPGTEELYLVSAPRQITLQIEGPKQRVEEARAFEYDPDITLTAEERRGRTARFVVTRERALEIAKRLRSPGDDGKPPLEYARGVPLQDLELPQAMRPSAWLTVKVLSALTLSFEFSAQRVVPVRANVQAKPDFGYEFEAPAWTVNHKEVLVTGPRSKVERLEYLETAALNLGAVSVRKDYAVPLTLPQGVRCQYELVVVTINVRQAASVPARKEKTLSGVKVLVLYETPEGEKRFTPFVSPPSATITFSGPPAAVDALSRDDVDLYVNLATLMKQEGGSIESIAFDSQGQFTFATRPTLEFSVRDAAKRHPELRLIDDPSRPLVVGLRRK